MAFESKTERLIALKKLLGKAHSSNDKGLSNEDKPSNITIGSNSIFGETIPTASINTNLWDRSGTGSAGGFVIEKVRLSASFIRHITIIINLFFDI